MTNRGQAPQKDEGLRAEASQRYITVVVGRDYQAIGPTVGYYEGEAKNRLDMSVSVVLESHGPAEHRLSGQGLAKPPLSLPDEQQQQ